jgi:hypothetical protein
MEFRAWDNAFHSRGINRDLYNRREERKKRLLQLSEASFCFSHKIDQLGGSCIDGRQLNPDAPGRLLLGNEALNDKLDEP